MLGGLLTLAVAAVADVALTRSAAAWRGLVFLLLTGSSCVLLSGLPEQLFPDLPGFSVMVFKASLGPLSGALALTYLGQWLGVAAEDRIVHNTIVWGSVALVLSAVLIAALAAFDYGAGRSERDLLTVAAMVNFVSVLLATLSAARAAQLGDELARSMVLACLFLAISVAGLFAHALDPKSGDLVEWLVTGFSTVAFFLVIVAMGVWRNRQNRHLARLATLARDADPATGLPRGSILLSKVDDAFWRSARLNSQCTVICLHLRNLYALAEEAGHGSDQQILASMAARIRRVVGFRCVVGLYHPRCFVVVLSALRQPRSAQHTLQRLQAIMAQPLNVLGSGSERHSFVPRFSFGAVTLNPQGADPATVIDEAEHQAMETAPDSYMPAG